MQHTDPTPTTALYPWNHPLVQRAHLVYKAAHAAIGNNEDPSVPRHELVVENLLGIPGITKEQLAVAYLIEVLYNTRMSYSFILEEFGPQVHSYLKELESILQLSGGFDLVSPEVQTVAYAGFYVAVTAPVEGSAPTEEYLSKVESLLGSLTKGDTYLRQLTLESVQNALA